MARIIFRQKTSNGPLTPPNELIQLLLHICILVDNNTWRVIAGALASTSLTISALYCTKLSIFDWHYAPCIKSYRMLWKVGVAWTNIKHHWLACTTSRAKTYFIYTGAKMWTYQHSIIQDPPEKHSISERRKNLTEYNYLKYNLNRSMVKGIECFKAAKHPGKSRSLQDFGCILRSLVMQAHLPNSPNVLLKISDSTPPVSRQRYITGQVLWRAGPLNFRR